MREWNIPSRYVSLKTSQNFKLSLGLSIEMWYMFHIKRLQHSREMFNQILVGWSWIQDISPSPHFPPIQNSERIHPFLKTGSLNLYSRQMTQRKHAFFMSYMVNLLKYGPTPWLILYPYFALPKENVFAIYLLGNITDKLQKHYGALKPHTTELSIHTISVLVLSEPPTLSSNVFCHVGFTLLTEHSSLTSVVTFFTLVFLEKLFLFSKPSMCVFPLAWSVKADCPEYERSNTLWKKLHRN